MGNGARKIAVYGEVDLNLVDGSAVWLQSICQVLGSLGDVCITLLLRRSIDPERRFLIEELEASGFVETVDPGQKAYLKPAVALDMLEELDRERGPFDLLLLRGQPVLTEIAARDSFDGRLWSYPMTGRGMPDEILRKLAARSDLLLCQTEAVAEEIRGIAPEADGSLLVLPPMIPDVGTPPSSEGAKRHLRLVYSGKLAPDYCWLETVDAFRRLRKTQPGAELHVIGDKVYRPPEVPDFPDLAMRALHETDGLRWHGAVSRNEVHDLLAACDLALSIRDPGVEAAREISTKVLEYGAAGLPIVLNRAPSYERLLGKDYPLFIDGPHDVDDVLAGPALDAEQRAAAAVTCHAASREFTFERVGARLAEHLPQALASASPVRPSPQSDTALPDATPTSANASGPHTKYATRVLVAGHDLKFLGPIREAIASAGAILAEDVWRNHTEHDEAASRAALGQADVILCEWCLGNAAWYSRNKRPDQRLVIRLHRMEVFTDHPAAVEFDNVDQVVCVAKHIADEAIRRFGWNPAKVSVINNSVDVARFHRPKREGSRHTLAMIGYVPRRKRLDLTLDILEELRQRAPRFRLLLVGHPPSEFDWVVRRPEEVEFFRTCSTRIQGAPELRGAVDFLPFSDDLPSLFETIGFVLSTSESEGHQVALAEGAASGAVPVLLDRPGASDHYPERWVHKSPSEAAAKIEALVDGAFDEESKAAAQHARQWSFSRLLHSWIDLLAV